jgi:leader peptidase (prepilin peptidase) / N-methyltransferase
MASFEIAIVFLLGLILGSFSSALIYRIPLGISWTSKRSACVTCQKSLGFFDLIPVMSWLINGGKCSACGHKVSARYPILEIAHGVAALVIYAVFGLSLEFWFILTALPILSALLVIDLDHMILPNTLVGILTGLGLVRLFLPLVMGQGSEWSFVYDHLLAAFAFAGLSWFLGWFLSRILKKDALGFGDVKFFFAAGLWLGLQMMPYFLIASGLLGVAFAIFWKVIWKKDVFPFGPSLIMSLFLLLILQNALAI